MLLGSKMAGAAKVGGLRMFKLTEIDEIDETEQVTCEGACLRGSV